jgi:hypothetical protein
LFIYTALSKKFRTAKITHNVSDRIEMQHKKVAEVLN